MGIFSKMKECDPAEAKSSFESKSHSGIVVRTRSNSQKKCIPLMKWQYCIAVYPCILAQVCLSTSTSKPFLFFNLAALKPPNKKTKKARIRKLLDKISAKGQVYMHADF